MATLLCQRVAAWRPQRGAGLPMPGSKGGKGYGCQLVISDLVAACAGLQMSVFPCHELTVWNRRDPLVIRTIDDVQALTQMPERSQTR